MKRLILISFVLFCLDSFCQVKPTPVNDTLGITSGRVYRSNVLYNDIKPGGKLIVTGFTVKTTTKRIPGTTVTIAGIGSLRVDSSGLLLFIPYNDTFIGELPAITYTLNNGLAGNGQSAKLFLNVFKPIQTPDMIMEFGKTKYGIMMESNGLTCFGSMREYYECGVLKHMIIFKDAVMPLWLIPEEIYLQLK